MTKLLDHWQSPPGAGRPVALVATTFTFDTDFFETQCLGRFLGLDTQRGEGSDLLAMIEEEERLAEVRVALVVDRSERPEGRNLRWDLLTLAVRGGLQHAKATLLVWDNLIRIVVGSANLTAAGYRSQVEIATAFDLFDGSSVPKPFALALLGAVGGIVSCAPGDRDCPGPAQRARQTLDDARRRISNWNLPERWTGDLRAVVAPSRPGTSPFASLDEVWKGSVPRRATVLSPFFDTDPAGSTAAERLADRLARTGKTSIRFCLPGDVTSHGTVVRAPEALAARIPGRIDMKFEMFRPSDDEPRRLHAKAIVLESESWIAALVGSSNFTAAGLGLQPTRGHVELNIWFGARKGTAPAAALQALVPPGDPIDPAAVIWEPEPDDDTPTAEPLPLGFADCLFDPSPSGTMITFHLDHSQLPSDWSVTLPGSGVLLTSSDWESAAKPAEHRVEAHGNDTPFFVDVTWTDPDGASHRAPWAVNVTEPGVLPPPEALRAIPAAALLAALASSRPLHESIVHAIERTRHGPPTGDPELDPLKKFTNDGLFRRTRRLSAALSGLQERLERPCNNLDALAWRLRGPAGPLAVARKLLEEPKAAGLLDGEVAFSVAEIALTLSRVRWERAATPAVRVAELRAAAAGVVEELASLIGNAPSSLAGYVKDAIEEARR